MHKVVLNVCLFLIYNVQIWHCTSLDLKSLNLILSSWIDISGTEKDIMTAKIWGTKKDPFSVNFLENNAEKYIFYP